MFKKLSKSAQYGKCNACSTKQSKVVNLRAKLTILSKEKDILQRENARLFALVKTLESSKNICMSDIGVMTSVNESGEVIAVDPITGHELPSPCPQVDPNTNTDGLVTPYEEHLNGVLSSINMDQFCEGLVFNQLFQNRSVAYYGEHPYNYSGGSHEAKPISENRQLVKMLSMLKHHVPNLDCNSALITKYSSGSEHLPFHSDNESCIEKGSNIVTISLGETRNIKFRDILRNHPETTTTLEHGDVLIMTQKSQSYYQHSIPKDFSKKVRISITLRKLSISDTDSQSKEATVSTPTRTAVTQSQEIPVDQTNSKSNCQEEKPITIYLSSSMFSPLKEGGLSSSYQDAKVFSYPGATVKNIGINFFEDSRAKMIDTSRVTKVIVLCGSNDIDSILQSPKHQRNLFIGATATCRADFRESCHKDVEDLVTQLHNWAPLSRIKMVNILPRESFCRNDLISNINRHISGLTKKYSFLDYVSTERDRKLFSDSSGCRKSLFFSNKGTDNVHLNTLGIIRLARHLKHIAHL